MVARRGGPRASHSMAKAIALSRRECIRCSSSRKIAQSIAGRDFLKLSGSLRFTHCTDVCLWIRRHHRETVRVNNRPISDTFGSHPRQAHQMDSRSRRGTRAVAFSFGPSAIRRAGQVDQSVRSGAICAHARYRATYQCPRPGGRSASDGRRGNEGRPCPDQVRTALRPRVVGRREARRSRWARHSSLETGSRVRAPSIARIECTMQDFT